MNRRLIHFAIIDTNLLKDFICDIILIVQKSAEFVFEHEKLPSIIGDVFLNDLDNWVVISERLRHFVLAKLYGNKDFLTLFDFENEQLFGELLAFD